MQQQQRLINNSSQLISFGKLFCPSSGALDCVLTACGIMQPRWCRPVAGRQHRGCIIPQAVTHSPLLLKMGKIVAQNMLS